MQKEELIKAIQLEKEKLYQKFGINWSDPMWTKEWRQDQQIAYIGGLQYALEIFMKNNQ